MRLANCILLLFASYFVAAGTFPISCTRVLSTGYFGRHGGREGDPPVKGGAVFCYVVELY